MTDPASAVASDPPAVYPLEYEMRVRWAEVDAQGVVFNGHYLLYTDICCTEYFRAAGIPQWSSGELHGPGGPNPEALDYYVVRASVEYRAPARFDDLLTLRGRMARLGNSSFTFECRMERGDQHLCTAETVSVNAHAGVSRPLPLSFRRAVEEYESGKPETRRSI